MVEVEETEIRGEKSRGMIAAANEIGLEDEFPMESEEEILDLSSTKASVGTPLAEALGQDHVIFEIDNKSMTRRPDLWGHYGIARELAVLFDKELEEYNPDEIKISEEADLQVEVKDKNLCTRYSTVSMTDIIVQESPQWLKKKLRAVDIEPVNNIVDITNYILMELGQPMHAFDKKKIAGDEINVRPAKKNEKIKALNDKEYSLSSDNLVIADQDKPVALAGIIGSQNSEVEAGTTDIILESANFDRVNIRRSAMQLGLRTDSSARFEKGLDPNNTIPALKRAVELIKKVCPEARVNSNVVDKSNFEIGESPIEVSVDYIQNKIGAEIEVQEIISILDSLEFEVEEINVELAVTIPSFRATVDITQKDDLVEEVARIYGYNNIQSDLPKFSISSADLSPLKELENEIKNILCFESGYTETHTYSFVSEDIINKLNNDLSDYIELKNPIAKDRPYLRRSLIPNLLEATEKNLDRYDEVALFEAGKVFKQEESGDCLNLDQQERLPRQDLYLAAIVSKEGDKTPFFRVKAALEAITNRLNIKFEYKPKKLDSQVFHSGRYAKILSNGESIGFISELHPLTQKKFDIDQRVGLFEINLNKLLEKKEKQKVYEKVPTYPAVSRDIAFVVDEEVKENIEENKKNMAYHINYRSEEKTLNSEEIDEIHSSIEEKLREKFNANIRD
ncbi:MAG: phenylalanine--tRNA ligase subunit beta [Parcubacteria group bacterium QH_9_35_7]|nr:MAG: phenylalanine--tRNA ligase subunit beta [Parcubacteria group bacterium QH_9_35_7]